MRCRHTGFHSITSRYDRDGEMLVYLRVCERCGAAVTEVERVSYRPRYEATPYGASRRNVGYGPAATWSGALDATKPDSRDGRVWDTGVR
jgi:hypothetical protein